MEETETGRRHGSADTPDDLISALPEDLLINVLERLGGASAAARTRLLSRRWHDLWTRLPKVTVALRDVPFGSLESALTRTARPGLCHYHLDILVPRQTGTLPGDSISSLLRASAALSPDEIILVLPPDLGVSPMEVGADLPVEQLFELRNMRRVCRQPVDLPRFVRTTSIDLRAEHLHLRLLQPSSWFPSLERLSLTGCKIDLAALIPCCPRLRVLRVNNNDLVPMNIITIHTASLQELYVESSNTWKALIDVEAPALKQLTMSFHARGDLKVFISAPMAEKKVSWRCLYTNVVYRLGLWGLMEVSLNSTDTGKGSCLQLPSVHVLTLHMAAKASYRFLNAEHNFGVEIDKHMMVTEFSGLDLRLRTRGHSFGAFVLRLIGMHRIRRAIRNLRIVLLRSEVKEACPVKCIWDEPKDWKTQTISLAYLETVDIEGVDGEDHEFDFLKMIFRCAPMLKKVTLRITESVTPCVHWCTKVNNIFKAHPLVKCNIDMGQLVAAKVLH